MIKKVSAGFYQSEFYMADNIDIWISCVKDVVLLYEKRMDCEQVCACSLSCVFTVYVIACD